MHLHFQQRCFRHELKMSLLPPGKPSAKLTPQRDFWVTPTPTLWEWGRDEHLFLIPKSLCEFADRPSCFLCCYCRSHPLIWVFGPVAWYQPGKAQMIFFIVFAKHKRADFLFDMTAPVTFASDTSSHLIILREKNKNQTTRAGFCLTFEQVTSLWWTLCCPLHSLGYERIEKLRIWPSTTFELCKIELLSLKWHSWFDLCFLEGFTWERDKLLKTLEKNFVKM